MKSIKFLTYSCVVLILLTYNSVYALTLNYDFKDTRFTEEQKIQIQIACNKLITYIANTDTITLELYIKPNIGAFATGRPYFSDNNPQKILPFKGEINYDSTSVIGEADPISEPLTIHELMHALGMTSWNSAFSKHVEYKMYGGAKTPFFKGPKLVSLNKEPAPLDTDGSHFIFGFRDPIGLMPRIAAGGGSHFSSLELAILADIGYSIPILDGKTEAFDLELPQIGKRFNVNTGDSKFEALPQDIAGRIQVSNAFTIEYWFKGTNIQSAFRLEDGEKFIISGFGSTDPKHVISVDGGKSGGLKIQTKLGGSVLDNQWHHIAVTWDAGKPDGFKSYVDGELVDKRDAKANVRIPIIGRSPMIGTRLYFEDNKWKYDEFTKGEIARYRVWKAARTEDEIKESKDKMGYYLNVPNILYQQLFNGR